METLALPQSTACARPSDCALALASRDAAALVFRRVASSRRRAPAHGAKRLSVECGSEHREATAFAREAALPVGAPKTSSSPKAVAHFVRCRTPKRFAPSTTSHLFGTARSALARFAAILITIATLGTITPTSLAATTPGTPILGGVCGFSWEYVPTSPFMGKNEIMDLGDYRFQYVEELAKTEVNGQGKDKPKIQLNLLFSPVPEAYLGGQLLGQGWWFPSFESTLLQTDARTYMMGLPNGDRVTLHRKGNSLGGGSWLGTIGTRETVLKTSCGWVVKFQQGRLVELNSPTRERYQFAISRDGVRTITYNGRVVLTLTRKIDEQTTFPVYTLSYVAEGKSQKAQLRMGLRPVLIKINEKENGRDVTKEREEDTNSLSSVKVADQPEKKYNFGIDALTVGRFHRWDKKTYNLLQKDQESYSTVVLKGIKCFKTTYPDGKTALLGLGSNLRIQQIRNGTIQLEEYTPKTRRTRQLYEINSAGNEILLKRFWYDEKGDVIRTWLNDGHGGITYMKNENAEITKDSTGNLIWEKRYDNFKRLISLKIPDTTYSFSYNNDMKNVIVKRQKDGETLDATITLDEFSSLTWGF